MRPLETIIPIILAIYILWPLTGRKHPIAVEILPAIDLIVTIFHFVFEGIRWQMIPLYGYVIFACLNSFAVFLKTRQGKPIRPFKWRTGRVVPSLILLAVSTALPILLPVPSIPTPGGPYQVGTRTFVLVDNSRRELFSGKNESRKFMIQVWYPAKPAPGDPHAPWMNDAHIYTRALSAYLELPDFFLDHLALAKSPAYLDAQLEPSNSGYPVILFSHGWSGFAAQNTGQMLQLASRGYVVAAVQHSYGAVVTVFPDGQIAYNNPNAFPEGKPGSAYYQTAHTLGDQWAEDISYTLDFFEQQSQDITSQFYSTLDLNRVGVYGHSTGGGAAIQFCGTDSRCKALLGMDPFLAPVSDQILEQGINVPTFFMFNQGWLDDKGSNNNRLFSLLFSHLNPSTRVIGIQGTKHYDFSDLPLLSPIAPQLGLKGPLNGKRVTQIVDDYLVSFFEKALNNKPSSLFDGPAPQYPEVMYTR